MKYDSVDRFMVRNVFHKAVKQGFTHKQNITGILTDLYTAVRKKFNEDNYPTAEAFMRECLEEAMQDVKGIEMAKAGINKFVAEQRPLGEPFNKILHENLTDLYEK